MRTVIWRTGALGDFVLTLPVIDRLAAEGDALVLAPERYRALRPALAWQDSEGAGTSSLFGASARLEADLGVAWTASAVGALRAAGVREVLAGSPRPPPGVRMVDHLWAPLAPRFGPRDRAPSVAVSASARGAARARFGAPVVISPGSGGEPKRWPLARWREVAAALDAPVLWVGGPLEAGEPGWPTPRCDDLGLADLAALASVCRAWLAPDSGPAHLAAAAGARVGVVFTGATDPACWAPLGATTWVAPDPGAVARWA